MKHIASAGPRGHSTHHYRQRSNHRDSHHHRWNVILGGPLAGLAFEAAAPRSCEAKSFDLWLGPADTCPSYLCADSTPHCI